MNIIRITLAQNCRPWQISNIYHKKIFFSRAQLLISFSHNSKLTTVFSFVCIILSLEPLCPFSQRQRKLALEFCAAAPQKRKNSSGIRRAFLSWNISTWPCNVRERVEVSAAGESGMRMRHHQKRGCGRHAHVYQGYQAASESSHWSRRAEKEEEGGGGGGGARGRQKDCAIKGQREPWWSSRASRCFEFKASFQDVKSRSVFAAHTGRGKQTKGKCIFEGFVPWFNFFTVSSTVIRFFSNTPYSLICTHIFLLIYLHFLYVSLRFPLRSDTCASNRQIRRRKQQRNNRDATAGWTAGWIQQDSDRYLLFKSLKVFSILLFQHTSRNGPETWLTTSGICWCSWSGVTDFILIVLRVVVNAIKL